MVTKRSPPTKAKPKTTQSKTTVESVPNKIPMGRPKSLTSKEYFTGVALGCFLSKTTGELSRHQMEDIKRQASQWGDFMVEE